MGRIGSIQAMRGAAAGLVVFAHAIDHVTHRSDAWGTPGLARLGGLADFGAIGVDLFFLISGFVMAEGLRGWRGPAAARDFLRQRFLRIAPLYWLVSAAALLAGLDHPRCGGACLANTLSFVPLGGGRYAMPALAVGWTLAFEMGFYLLVALVIASGAAKPRRTLLALLLVLPLLARSLGGVPILGWMTNAIVWEFAFGVALNLLWRAGILHRHAPAWRAAALAAVVLFGLEIVWGYGPISESGSVVAGGVSAARVLLWGLPMALIAAAALPLGAEGRPGLALRRLGDTSFSIYLVHQPLFFAGRTAAAALAPAGSADTMVALFWAAGIGAGLLLHRAVEAPLLRRLKRPSSGTAPSLAAYPA